MLWPIVKEMFFFKQQGRSYQFEYYIYAINVG